MKNLPYLLALHSVDGLGPIRLKKILEYFKDPKVAWEAQLTEYQKLGIPKSVVEQLKERRKVDPQDLMPQLEKSGIKILTIFDGGYPKLLKEIYDPPVVLYYKGEILPEDRRAIGVVGTRKVTGYGRAVTEKFCQGLVSAGVTIVSGLARGVDTVAHKAALESSGRTIAVLGGGINQIFPSENTKLAERITKGFGAVISEFPPDYPSLAGNFPARNRIIAGLSLGILVTEAAEDSGSLITARVALDEGREVFAVPGPITSDLSKGPADLIKTGAKLAFEVTDILEELGLDAAQNLKLKVQSLSNLSAAEKTILECLENESKHIDEICRQLQKSTAEVSANLVKMEILGLVKNLGGGIYSKTL